MVKHMDKDRFCRIHHGDKEKPTIILMHGFMSASNWLSDIEHKLNDNGYSTINCLMRGHGKRIRESDNTDWVGMLEEIDGMVNEANSDVVLIGHSMGGTLAITEGLKNPKVKKVFALSAINGNNLFNGVVDKLKKKYKYVQDKAPFVEQTFPSNNINGCPPNSSERFFLVHSIHDEVVPFNQFEENVKGLCLDKDRETNTLILDNGKKKWHQLSFHTGIHKRKDVQDFILRNL